MCRCQFPVHSYTHNEYSNNGHNFHQDKMLPASSGPLLAALQRFISSSLCKTGLVSYSSVLCHLTTLPWDIFTLSACIIQDIKSVNKVLFILEPHLQPFVYLAEWAVQSSDQWAWFIFCWINEIITKITKNERSVCTSVSPTKSNYRNYNI